MKKPKFKIGDRVLDEHLDWYCIVHIGDKYMDVEDADGMLFEYQSCGDFKKTRPVIFSTDMVRAILEGRKTQTRRVLRLQEDGDVAQSDPVLMKYLLSICPYGQPGDILYVRETFAPEYDGQYLYKAGFTEQELEELKGARIWKPSIHMPRQAARLFLKVQEVRVERLCDISEADAVAEGIEKGFMPDHTIYKFSELWDSINKDRADWLSNPWVWAVTFSKIANP